MVQEDIQRLIEMRRLAAALEGAQRSVAGRVGGTANRHHRRVVQHCRAAATGGRRRPRAGDAVTIAAFDAAALDRWLGASLPGYAGPLAVEQIFGGQSNPTFILRTPRAAYVLRKKPPGTLLASAHAIDREYRAMSALAGSAVPVPRQLLYCSDRQIVGTEFIIMQYMAGRVFHDPQLPGLAVPERAAIYDSMNETLASLHGIDVTAVGLADFGKPQDYCARQTARWIKQYRASETHRIEVMEALMDWLPRHVPADQSVALVHGDFRLENMIIDAHRPKVIAVVDWELSTLGHPFADLAHCCMLYRLPVSAFGGFLGADLARPRHSRREGVCCRLLRTARHRTRGRLALLHGLRAVPAGRDHARGLRSRLAGQNLLAGLSGTRRQGRTVRRMRMGGSQRVARSRWPAFNK